MTGVIDFQEHQGPVINTVVTDTVICVFFVNLSVV